MTAATKHRLALVAVAVVSGCSALVGPAERTRCRPGDDGIDPCPPGQSCREGFCTATGPQGDGGPGDAHACSPEQREECNGVDDDCNGRIDEGFDGDGDGTVPCGEASRRDCDDADPRVHPELGENEPAARERCDGKDNDCDGTVDEAPDPATPCPAGESCARCDGGECPLCGGGQECFSGICAAPDCTKEGHECPAEQHCDTSGDVPECRDNSCVDGTLTCEGGRVCDEGTGGCVMPNPDGSPCVIDAQCESGSCMPGRAIGVSAEAICARACCRDSDCGDGFVCWPSVTGARACVPQAMLPVVRGPAPANAQCSANAECQSGICLGGSAGCLGNCQDTSACTDRECVVTTYSRPNVSDFVGLACLDAVGSSGTAATCNSDDDCRSNRCTTLTDGIAQIEVCSQACRTSRDCPRDVDWNFGASSADTYCGVVSGDPAAMCRFKDHDGDGEQGTQCNRDDDCWDKLCEQGVCAQTCCHDRDCPAETHCRPVNRGSTWGMHCVP